MVLTAGAAVVELLPFMCHRLRMVLAPVADALGIHYAFWQPGEALVPALSTKASATPRGTDVVPVG